MQLENKRIVVAGGSRGIGAATVRIYVREGAQVVFCGTNDERGRQTEAEANAQEDAAGHATYLHCDIADRDQVNAFFDEAVKLLGGLDVLANVAGIESNNAAVDYTDEQIDRLMDVNFKGTVHTNQAAYRAFTACGSEGSIINYSSDTALTGMPNGAVYAASKSAVLGWSRSIAREWGQASNVRTNCVNPTIQTEMYKQWLATADPKLVEYHKQQLKANYPIDGAMGDADRDCAPVMVFLASDASRYVNGQIICVNGGAYTVR